MGLRGGRVNPMQNVSLERERRKKWGAGGERMDGGAEIVEETGEGEFECAGGAAWLGLGFEDVDVEIALGEGYGGGEAVGAGAGYGGSGGCWLGGAARPARPGGPGERK